MFGRKQIVDRGAALRGRDTAVEVPSVHFVNGHPLEGPWPEGTETVVFGMGCFWGAERLFWEIDGVYSTSAGYAGGYTPNASYREVCSGATGHAEAVLVAYYPSTVTFELLLRVFWEGHDPTQGMRQGNDTGTQYRSAIYTSTDEQLVEAQASLDAYQRELERAGYGPITTEVEALTDYYYAEDYHQQYLAKNPSGYCGIGGTGVACSTGLVT